MIKNLEFFELFIRVPKIIETKNRRKYINSFLFSLFKLIPKVRQYFIK